MESASPEEQQKSPGTKSRWITKGFLLVVGLVASKIAKDNLGNEYTVVGVVTAIIAVVALLGALFFPGKSAE